MKRIATLAAALTAASSLVAGYRTRVIATGLPRPTGIAVGGNGIFTTLYVTLVPTPGLPGSMGGKNSVIALHPRTGEVETLSAGEPEPVNIALRNDGALYWTCKSAGVILGLAPGSNTPMPIVTELEKPSGIAVGPQGLFFTQIPTPGVPGSMGGRNTVNLYDGNTVIDLTVGEPEPTDIVVSSGGTAYWTCKSANVILRRTPNGTVSIVLENLNKSVGITLDENRGNLFFTEVPTPGVPGGMGGQNRVWEYDLRHGDLELVDFGDPEPTDITVANNGRLFWTCSSAGVIGRPGADDR